ncbi:MAG TPA: type II toxin-antitoxin system prevent-host-death family antitoxin [Pilimelia sp.]|nr:type II toxin-antitoxin system prevent-host-death family antitoxin [Pilimelia sp.]
MKYYSLYYSGGVEQIPMRALNQDTAGVLARVQNGEVVEVTNRGRPIARIVPIGAEELNDLVASGAALAPTIREPFPMPVFPSVGESDAGALLAELRDEERW